MDWTTGFLDVISLRLLPLIVNTSFVFMGCITALVFCLLLIKVTAVLWETDISNAKKWILPVFEKHLDDPAQQLPVRFLKMRWPLRRVLQYVIVHRSFGETGEKLGNIARAYEALGFVDGDFRRMRSPFWWVRAEAARCLGQMKASRAKNELLLNLKDSVTEVRLVSAWALGRIGEADAIQPILDSLVKASKLAGMRLSSTVFELGEKAVQPLISALKHQAPDVKILALHLLGELNDKKAVPHIIVKAKSKENLEVRLAAYKALGTIADSSAGSFLIKSLKDPSWQVRAQAARGLGIIGSDDAIPRLCGTLDDPKWWVRRNSGEALIKTGEKGKAALLSILRSAPSSPGGRMAAQWLDEYGYLP
ncbi:MAG: HEAT repeat domain-containing protein [bacterium]